jgi:hypothetical protein
MAKINTAGDLLLRVFEMLPKNIPMSAIESVEIDGYSYNRYWVYLNKGWQFENSHTINENSLTEIRKCLKLVQKVDEDDDDEQELSAEEIEKVLAWLNRKGTK